MKKKTQPSKPLSLISVLDTHAIIHTDQGGVLIDADDVALVKDSAWRIAARPASRPTVLDSKGGTLLFALYGVPHFKPKFRNGDSTDCRRSNILCYGPLCAIEPCSNPVQNPSGPYCQKHKVRKDKYGDPLGGGKSPRIASEVEIKIKDGVGYVPLNAEETEFALIDAGDVPLVSEFVWSKNGTGYAARGGHTAGVSNLMHRFLLSDELSDDLYVDHINHNGLDNRRSNLRPATPEESASNTRARSKSGYKGVCFTYNERGDAPRPKPWRAEIRSRVNGKRYYLGRYSTPEEAARAVDAKAYELRGEYAWLNFPEDYGLPARSS